MDEIFNGLFCTETYLRLLRMTSQQCKLSTPMRCLADHTRYRGRAISSRDADRDDVKIHDIKLHCIFYACKVDQSIKDLHVELSVDIVISRHKIFLV